MLLSVTWDPNPEIFRLGGFAVRWYGLLFASSFFFGYLIMQKFFKKEGVPIKLLDELTTYMIIGTIVGARLGHVFFYEPAWYLAHPIKILEVWEGGLASHGAAIGIILSLLLYSHFTKKPFLWVMDRIVVVVALSGFFIRMGNLMNSEIYGLPTNLPWGFRFLRSTTPSDGLVPRHPTQIYEGLTYLGIFLFLWWYYYKKQGKPAPGMLFGLFLISVFGMRFLIEFIKEPQVGFERGMTLNMGQLLSIPFIIAGIIFIYFAKKKKEDSLPVKDS
ncbi:MAG: prolipoprotein diacylglyceryl transferase [Bacteroidales bacterium]|nr:prolipoprotein diacylglyceryl transferase [Bacteroidales bacterium]MDD4602979.1 prolipoprotein diacylglyceryl transferase [Bacteroidales bacterium]